MSATTQGEAGAPEAPAAKKGGKKKLILLVAVVVLVGGGAAGLWFTGILPRLLGRAPAPPPAEVKEKIAPPVFVELPEMIANLNGGGRRQVFVKLQVKLELEREEDRALLMPAMPRVIDLFQTYLREMHPEELRGSAGTYRLREELMARVAVAVPPVHVRDVLFTQLIVQ